MGLLKPKGRKVLVDESMLPLMDRLRACMVNTAHSSGLVLNRAYVPSDGIVVAFSLTMTELLMNPKFALIDRQKFLATMEREIVRRVPEFESRTVGDRMALIDLLMASCCEFSAYNPDSPIKAAGTPGGKPN